ncbi:MAG: response regulator transcription factor [Chloroflexota bacterium]|nr:response regulator transcription factor [Chloroflexota bacterium]
MRILLGIKRSDLRLGLEMLLDEQPGCTVAGSITDATSLLALVKTARPDLVVLDWDLPGEPLAEVLGSVQAAAPRPAIIVLGVDASTEQPALAAGADAFVLKGDPPEELLITLRRVHQLPHQ